MLPVEYRSIKKAHNTAVSHDLVDGIVTVYEPDLRTAAAVGAPRPNLLDQKVLDIVNDMIVVVPISHVLAHVLASTAGSSEIGAPLTNAKSRKQRAVEKLLALHLYVSCGNQRVGGKRAA
eukprot:4647502-Amphidinium_carterae.1